MPLLNQSDRDYILDQLRLAPDEILADAMLAFNAARDKIVAVRKLNSGREIGTGEPDKKVDNTSLEGVHPTPRANVDPGPSSITKIGGETKAMLLLDIRCNKQPPAKYAEHLKLLWARGEVKFDGKEYYL